MTGPACSTRSFSGRLSLIHRVGNSLTFVTSIAFINECLSLDAFSCLGDELSSLGSGSVCVLADNLVGSLTSLSNFEHGVLAVDSLSLTVLAEVVIVAS